MEDDPLAFNDFKHSNYHIRIYRAQHLDTFIELIELSQLKEQLLPFLLEIILNFETSEEVLLEYSRHLKDIFFLLIKAGEISKITLRMIVFLCNHEDDQVRKVSLAYFKEIMLQYHSDKFIEEELFPILDTIDSQRKLGNCNIIPMLFNYSTSTNNKSILLNSFVDYCRNDNVYYRRQAASSIKYFFNETNPFIMHISDEFFRLLLDPSELVKVNIIESASFFIKILSSEKQKELITDRMLGIITHEKSWKIKVAISNLICSICYYFDPQFNEDYFLLFLVQTLKDNEVEVKLNTLANLQIYLKAITEKTIREKIEPLFVNDLSNDPNWNVRAANAVMILKLIFQIPWDDNNTNTFYPIISKLIKDDPFEAKYYFISKMSLVFKECSQSSSSISNIVHSYYYPIISEAMQNYNWRLRFEAEKAFYDILTIYKGWLDDKETILRYVYIFYTDNSNEIRQHSLMIIQFMLKMNQSLIDDIWRMQTMTLESKNYSLRIFALKSIIHLLPQYQSNHINDEVIPFILGKLDDGISNVRLFAYEAIVFFITNESYNAFLDTIRSKIKNRSISQYKDIQLKINQLVI